MAFKICVRENISCPDCKNEYDNIGELRNTAKKMSLLVLFVVSVKKEISEHECNSKHVFEKKPFEQM